LDLSLLGSTTLLSRWFWLLETDECPADRATLLTSWINQIAITI